MRSLQVTNQTAGKKNISNALPIETDEASTSFLGFFERIGDGFWSFATSIFLGIIRMSRLDRVTDGNRVTLWDTFPPDFFSAEASSLTARAKSSSTAFRLCLNVIPWSKSPGVLLLDCKA